MTFHGINLGGWLVAERWMTPELFEGVSGEGERAIGLSLGSEEARRRINRHRDTFITDADFSWIAAHGFDFVRIPVGYWLFEEAEGYVSGSERLDEALGLARKHNLKVLIDLHGLQGSQNGNDHSGEAGRIEFYKPRNIARALATVTYIANTYGHAPNLLAIEVINEPSLARRNYMTRLINYYEEAYRLISICTPDTVKVVVSDGFKTEEMLRALESRGLGDRLVMDIHHYQLYTDRQSAMSLQEHLDEVDVSLQPALRDLGTYMPIMVGEWSAALPAQAVEGNPAAHRMFYEAQRHALNDAWAQCYWSYKVPGGGAWSYRDLPFVDN